MKYTEDCPHCGNKITAYTHTINKPLASAFIKLVDRYLEVRRPIKIAEELGLNHNQLANWQKMRYYGIVQMVDNNGTWVPTPFGLKFYYGEVGILAPVATMAGNVLPDDHEAWQSHCKPRSTVFINEIADWHYKQRPEYKQEKSPQTSLF